MKESTRLTTFRQDIYEHVFTKERNVLQETLDALLLGPPIRSFPELTLNGVFKRQWPSLYKAMERGQICEETLSRLLFKQLPDDDVLIFPLDESDWLHPDAATLEDRGFPRGATSDVKGAGIGIGHSYSVLAFSSEPRSSWTLPLSARRVATSSDAIVVGAEQVKELLEARAEGLSVIVGDGRYGNHRFMGALREETDSDRCGVLVRMRANRVLYGKPGPYCGRGRRPRHGAPFRFKDEKTWPEPDQCVSLTDPRYGEVELRLWQNLHAKEDADTTFSVLLARVHLEKERPADPLWLAWRGPALEVEDLWRTYHRRSGLEASFRFRKQHLGWTVPRLGTIEASLRWTQLVTIAQWTLYRSRTLVEDRPLPWQARQVNLTPERVKQSFGGYFSELGTPSSPPQTRGKAPGWPRGKPRKPRDRHPVVRKGARKAKKGTKKARP